MSWLNLNQSLSSLKGQITNFATEVLSEDVSQDNNEESSRTRSSVKELEDKCHNQELEIATLKQLTEELQTTLQSERLARKNGVREEESSWYWDPSPQISRSDHEIEKQYKLQIQALQSELSALKDREMTDQTVDNDDELNRLREENKNLNCSLEDLDNQHQVAMEKLLTLKKELQKNFEVLKQEHEEFKNANDEYTGEIKVLLQKISAKDQQIENVKLIQSDYDTLLHKYQNLERIHSLLKENAEKFQEENQELHEEIFKLQEKITKLEHDVEVAVKQTELSNMVPKDKYEELLKEINDLKHQSDSNQVHLDKENIDDNAKSIIKTLKRDTNELKRKLAQRGSEYEEATENKVTEPNKIMQLYNKYVEDLTTENEYLTSDIQHLESELKETKKNNDFLISEIAALKNASKLEPIIETPEDNLVKLETELADCNRINQTFESELKRIENELTEVQSEKKKLQENLNAMKNKYTSMLDELKVYKSQTQAVQELENNANITHSAKLQKTEDEIDDLKKRLNFANSKNEQLSKDLHIIENDKVLLIKNIDDLQHKKQLLSDTHEELKSVNRSLDGQLKVVENRLHNSNKLRLELEIKLRNAEKELNEIHKQNEKIEKENGCFRKNIKTTDSIASSTNRIEEVMSENTLLSSKLHKIQKENTLYNDTNVSLINKFLNLQKQQLELSNENNLLKENSLADARNLSDANETIIHLKLKADQLEVNNNELLHLREENKKLLEKIIQLEVELSSTDGKIGQLEEDFERLISDLNEKDSIIYNLNITIHKNKAELTNLNQNATDLESSVQIKSREIETLLKTVQEVTEKFNNTIINSKQIHEELKILTVQKEEIYQQVNSLNDEMNNKNAEISRLTSLFQELEKSHSDGKLLIETRDKEIKELNQTIVELNDKIRASKNTTLPNDDYAKLLEEKQAIENLTTQLKDNIAIKEKRLLEMQNKVLLLENTCKEFKTMINNATVEKDKYDNLVNLIRNESIQYHNEIQRLNHTLLEQSNEFKRIIAEKDLLLTNHSNSCSNCKAVLLNLKEKDEIIKTLNENMSEHEGLKGKLLNVSETVKSLTRRCEDFEKHLAIQSVTVKKLTAENVQLSEKEQNSLRNVERLRRHLMEMEEGYTQEMMASEQKLNECQTRLHQVEERAKQTSTVYTSNSIRANQEVETLRNQIKLLEKQREEVQTKLSEADDARIRSEAALTNLQVVLEQFQLDKEKDINEATEIITNKMEYFQRQNGLLQIEIVQLNRKMEESKAGLQAATRLGDQVETKSAQIKDLKEQVRALQKSASAAGKKYHNAISNQQDKVDKNLIKNLVINYVLAAYSNSHNKTQILHILSTVLDFNQSECEKLGLARSSNTGDSLAAEFVKFLQNESKPRAPLPDMMGLQGGRATNTVPSVSKTSAIGTPPVLEVGHRRNPSTGSSNLLFQNLDAIETSSQVSLESDNKVIPVSAMDTGINQTRNNEGAILKHVLKDM